jgi:hypothetical protein
VAAIAISISICALAGAARADGVPIEEASPAQLSAAQKTFEAADELYDGQQYAAAIKAFRTSFEIVASPNSRLMIARSMEKLGNVADAYVELESAVGLAEKAAAKDAKYQATLKAVREELAVLKGKVAVVRVKLADPPPGTVVTVAGRTIEPAALSRPVVVAPGAVTVVAKAEGHSEVQQNVDIAAGAEADVELALVPVAQQQAPVVTAPPSTAAPPPERSSGSALRTAGFVAGGFGAANLVAFVIFGAIHNGKYSDLEEGCPRGSCPPELQEDIDSGRTFQTLANTSLVIGAVGVAAGVTLFVLGSRSSQQAQPSASASVAVTPSSLRFTGRF